MNLAQEPITICRAFADLSHGQAHYRHAGAGQPVLLLHGSPGSSRQSVGLIGQLAADMQVIALDTPGNGDSQPMPGDGHEIADLAKVVLTFLDCIGLDTVHVYGTHTGAAIAAELAILAPDRTLSVMLDGVSNLEGGELADFLANYAAPFAADLEGAYLARLFDFCRNQYSYFPWYRRTPEAQRNCAAPKPDDLDALVLETLKARTSYHRNYHAAFRWDAKTRLPLVACPAMLMASQSDPLFFDTQALAQFLPGRIFQPLPRYDEPEFGAERRKIMTHFLAKASV